jgi:glycosyltransferase involved in cell wall biosynthesis
MLLHGFFPMEVRVAAEARAAVDGGFDVDVICLRRPEEPAIEDCDGATVYRLPLSHVRGAGPLAVVWEYVGFTILASVKAAQLTLRRRYDVIQVHNPPDFLILGALVPRLLGARMVFDVHDLAPDMFHMRFDGRRGAALADGILRLIERRAIRAAHHVLTVHEPYRQELIARGASPESVSVVLNTLDERLLPSPADRAEANGFLVTYHGTVTPHYGVDLLIGAAAEAAGDVPQLKVEIYGEGDALPAVVERARQLRIVERVWVSPKPLPQRDVLKAVQRASVGVVPNLPTRLNRFALSTKLFEYVALGVPVVCADLPTIRAYFSEREVLFFRAGDECSLAEALVEVARHPEEAEARARAARRRYEDYRWPLNAARYLEVVRRTAGARKNASSRPPAAPAA